MEGSEIFAVSTFHCQKPLTGSAVGSMGSLGLYISLEICAKRAWQSHGNFAREGGATATN